LRSGGPFSLFERERAWPRRPPPDLPRRARASRWLTGTLALRARRRRCRQRGDGGASRFSTRSWGARTISSRERRAC
jgi:hypothetical protein